MLTPQKHFHLVCIDDEKRHNFAEAVYKGVYHSAKQYKLTHTLKNCNKTTHNETDSSTFVSQQKQQIAQTNHKPMYSFTHSIPILTRYSAILIYIFFLLLHALPTSAISPIPANSPPSLLSSTFPRHHNTRINTPLDSAAFTTSHGSVSLSARQSWC